MEIPEVDAERQDVVFKDKTLCGSSRCSMDEIISIYHAPCRMAFSQYNLDYRHIQKLLEKIYRKMIADSKQRIKRTGSDQPVKSTISPAELQSTNTAEDPYVDVDSFIKSMKATVNEIKAHGACEINHLNGIKRKLEKLIELSKVERPNIVHAYRLIAEFLLRRGFYEAGNLLIDQLKLHDEFTVGAFQQMVYIRDSLTNADPKPFIEWATKNSTRLKQFNSRLENLVHLLNTHDELLKLSATKGGENHHDKIKTCLKYLHDNVSISNFHNDYSSVESVESIMVMFAIPPELIPSEEHDITNSLSWSQLAQEFTTYYFHANQVGQKDPFEAALECGMLLTKAPSCYNVNTTNQSTGCPTCHPLLRTLSYSLPMPNRKISTIICRYTNELINEHNPGMMLPNGQIYGESAIQKLVREDGSVVCPQTGDVCQLKHIKKIFIV
ncbi:hypothetical protein GJ496_009526 [Pomphorhynchus laevis]|nr:hypothetical protein GJ496_009526 [Pomphorhynchus laevis]